MSVMARRRAGGGDHQRGRGPRPAGSPAPAGPDGTRTQQRVPSASLVAATCDLTTASAPVIKSQVSDLRDESTRTPRSRTGRSSRLPHDERCPGRLPGPATKRGFSEETARITSNYGHF
jgi:hypothetical protein